MLSARGDISVSSVLGIVLFLVVVGSYGLAFLPEAGALRSLVVLIVLALSVFALVVAINKFLASALLASYQFLIVFSVFLYVFFSIFKGYEFEASRIFLWVSASIWAAMLWSNVPSLVDWYERSLFVVTILTLGLVFFLGGALEEYTLTSRNYWSFFLVPLLSGFFLLKYIRSERVSILLCLLVFLVSVLTQGRSGILSSGIILFSSFLYNLRFMSKFLNRFFFFFGILSLVTLVFAYALLNGFFDYAITKGLGDHARSNIIYEYVLNLNGFVEFVSGVPVYLITSAKELNYNLHNTFIYFHSRFGVYFFVMFFLVFLAFFRALSNGCWVLFLVFCSILLRFSTDSGWGFNSIALHFMCLFGLGYILNSISDFDEGLKVSLGNMRGIQNERK